VAEAGEASTIDLVGGVVAFNEERHLAAAVESLFAQELPRGARWRTVWVVASGCVDRTVEVAATLAALHPELRLLVQAERRGKAAALQEIFARAQGDFLILLNADAVAQPGAVGALLRTAKALPPPYAVMGHPTPPDLPPKGVGAGLHLLWELHHQLHAELLGSAQGTHLSDELLLLPVSHLPPLPPEVVNDGAFIGAWLHAHGGGLAYARDAAVRIEVPSDLANHIRQRRRILFGHRQVTRLVGVAPTTMERFVLRHPKRALALVRASVRRTPSGYVALLWLAVAEGVSMMAALWDSIPPQRNHRLWEPTQEAAGSRAPSVPTIGRTSQSVAPSDRAG
jgi:glycosyltransferase involved in cell wall biosynthesis